MRGEAATALIRGLAEEQHGIVARRQLIAAGLGKGLIQDRVRTGQLAAVHRGVYAVGHRRNDLRNRWMAAVLACGDRAALSHRSAAHLWGLRGSRGPVQVTRLSGGRRRAGIVVMQTAALPVWDLTVNSGIQVTTVERTLLDLASELDARQLERAIVAAERQGSLSWRRMRRMLAEGEGRIGIVGLRQVIDAVEPQAIDTRSGLEVDFLGICRDAGLTAPAVNVLVGGHMVDFLWPTERLVVEVDSYRYHGDRGAFARDHDATIALEVAGYRVHRIADAMLESDPASFVELVRSTLRSRRR